MEISSADQTKLVNFFFVRCCFRCWFGLFCFRLFCVCIEYGNVPFLRKPNTERERAKKMRNENAHWQWRLRKIWCALFLFHFVLFGYTPILHVYLIFFFFSLPIVLEKVPKNKLRFRKGNAETACLLCKRLVSLSSRVKEEVNVICHKSGSKSATIKCRWIEIIVCDNPMVRLTMYFFIKFRFD